MQGKLTEAADLVKGLVAQAAEKDGEFYLPLSKDRVEALRSVSSSSSSSSRSSASIC